MNIFKRLFKIGQAEAHSAVDKLEDPIKLTEQGIRDMKSDLDKGLQALAEVKALAIRTKSDTEMYKLQASDYEKKAVLLLQRAQKSEIPAAEADRLATEALVKKDESFKNVARTEQELVKHEQAIAQLERNIKTIRSNISTWENELRVLKARVKVAAATKNINKQMAQIDSSGTVAMLERMKEKVAQDEALAASYGEIASEAKSVDDEINKALEGSAQSEATDALAALKTKLGIKE